jgi:hypothetical protein
MLAHLRHRVEQTLAQTHRAMLSTWGPADIQSSEFECQAHGMFVYLRVPLSSDHLFNLEFHARVVLSAAEWQMRGHARLIADEDAPPGLTLGAGDHGRWTRLVEIAPQQMRIAGGEGAEDDTIDFGDEDLVEGRLAAPPS